MTTPDQLEARFWSKVDRSGSCWMWLAGGTREGYGQFYDAVRKRMTKAHRFAYELQRGPVPAGLYIDHICRVPRCVNPDHLEAVTNKENILRGVGWGATNARKTACPRGHVYDEANTYLYDGRRYCYPCIKAASRRTKARLRAEREAAA